MSNRAITELFVVRRTKGDDAARKLVLKTVAKHGTKEAAAKALGVSVRTLYRVIDSLGLHAAIDEAVQKAGHRSRAGRPRGPLGPVAEGDDPAGMRLANPQDP